MKANKTLIYVLLVFICTAQRCKRGGSDLLSRIYEKAYKSEQPLSVKKDPVFTPLLGSWLVGTERMMVVTKVDATNLQFSFLSNSLTGEDINYSGFTTTISQKKYLNMLSYKDNYMFFKLFTSETGGFKLSMITNKVRLNLENTTIYDYLAKNPSLTDTGSIWFNVTLVKFSDVEREKYIRTKYKGQISGIESFLIFDKKCANDPDRDSLKTVALNYSLKEAKSINELMAYTETYPEIKNKAIALAKNNCKTTRWCVDYVNYFPNDADKDSIITIAFAKAQSTYDYELLLNKFPSDSRATEFEFKIAMEELKRANTYYSSSDAENFETRFKDRPGIINNFNTLRLINNVKVENDNFYNLSYVLNESGIAKIDQFVQLIKVLNKDKMNIKDVYFIINSDSAYSSTKSDLINFKLGVNRCVSVSKMIQKKYPEIKVHVVPYLTNNFNSHSKKSSTFFFNDEQISREKRDFYDDCYRVQQTVVIPNAQKELLNQEYVREEELEEYVLNTLSSQIPLFQKQQTYLKTIPPNFWDGLYKSAQPYYSAIKEKILLKAAEKGIDGKKLQNFVIQ